MPRPQRSVRLPTRSPGWSGPEPGKGHGRHTHGWRMGQGAETTAACLSTHARIIPGQRRWRWDLNPRKTCAFTRFRVLRTTVHRRPSASVACANTITATTGERWRTEVNETKTEPRPRAGPELRCGGRGRPAVPARCRPCFRRGLRPQAAVRDDVAAGRLRGFTAPLDILNTHPNGEASRPAVRLEPVSRPARRD
jgi:hypothetical protein